MAKKFVTIIMITATLDNYMQAMEAAGKVMKACEPTWEVSVGVKTVDEEEVRRDSKSAPSE